MAADVTHLLARVTREVTLETPVNRWDRDDFTLPGRTLLYRIWGHIGQLLYVGVSGNPRERWRRHAQKAPWWPDVKLITYDVFHAEHLALAAERAAIRAERPRHNRRSAVS